MWLKRRQQPRYQPPASMTVEVHIMGTGSLNILRARDISLSGLGVRVPHGLSDADLNRELDLVITLPGRRSFSARGVVRHRNNETLPNIFGIELTEVKPDDRDAIRAFVDALAATTPDVDTTGPGDDA